MCSTKEATVSAAPSTASESSYAVCINRFTGDPVRSKGRRQDTSLWDAHAICQRLLCRRGLSAPAEIYRLYTHCCAGAARRSLGRSGPPPRAAVVERRPRGSPAPAQRGGGLPPAVGRRVPRRPTAGGADGPAGHGSPAAPLAGTEHERAHRGPVRSRRN